MPEDLLLFRDCPLDLFLGNFKYNSLGFAEDILFQGVPAEPWAAHGIYLVQDLYFVELFQDDFMVSYLNKPLIIPEED